MMSSKTVIRDLILDEIHRTRQQIAEKFGGDIKAILADAQKRQEASGRAIWKGSSKQELNPDRKKSAS